LFEGFVPQVPVPTLPVITLKDVAGRLPVAPIVTAFAVERAHRAELLPFARHSTMKTWSPGVKPEPETLTTWRFFSPVEGRTVILRGPCDVGAVVVVVAAGAVVVVVPDGVVVVVVPDGVVVVVALAGPNVMVWEAFSEGFDGLATARVQEVSVVPMSQVPVPVAPAKTWNVVERVPVPDDVMSL
jgi:hypothetical protein